MKILVLSRYNSLGASSRYRIFQFLPYFEQKGWEIKIHCLLNHNYISYLYQKTKLPIFEILISYLKRIHYLLKKSEYDVVWLQQEAFPWIPTWLEKLFLKQGKIIIVDFDDAFFYRYEGHSSKIIRFLLGKKIDKIMQLADVVVVGNQYLAERALLNNTQKIVIIPTVVDINRYHLKKNYSKKKFTVGWIGSPHNAKYLNSIKNVIRIMIREHDIRFIAVGSGILDFVEDNIIIREWSENSEIENILSFDVGIMPLIDSIWERGKCGFKLIQYMACGIPVVASPVGMNSQIVKHGENGFLAKNEGEWIKYLLKLKNAREIREKFGISGRKIVEEEYSLQVIAPKVLRLFRDTLQAKS